MLPASLKETEVLCGDRKYLTFSATCQDFFRKLELKAMSIESAIEERIKEAMARGEFDNLAGHGKKIDLDAYFNTPEDLRMAFAMLKSNEFVPEEVEIFKEISELKEKIRECSDVEEEKLLTKRLNERSVALAMLLDRRKRR